MPGWWTLTLHTEKELALIDSLSPSQLPDLPSDPSNRVANDPAAAAPAGDTELEPA
jgi:hypothetical protein